MSRPCHDIPVFVIAGPTASGKTALAIALAQRLNAELVGADSMQVYRHMDIGTAKPTADELAGIPHHLIDVVDPSTPYDAARYATDADRAIADIHRRGKRVILVGGTGLYIRVLLRGLQSGPPPDDALRQRLTDEARDLGWPALHQRLRDIDPAAAQRLHPNDGVRIVRALEVFAQTGIPLTEWQAQHRFAQHRYPHRFHVLDWPREALNRRIDTRVTHMMEQGFLGEVQALLGAGYAHDLKPMQALGYRQLCAHLLGNTALAEATEQIKTETRRFAKRQGTWFRSEANALATPPDVDALFQSADAFFGAHPR
ncbi:MAG: tRNA (adenosine(37)-N6)-dimethylallyltransferase MiaA [Proteobacteria bacterium]|nr:tRNA (adenosine(37)-N6)-dimethylallyltransferase MiaA [Pseudomonadota bacterium]